MANELNYSAALSEGVASMEKGLDAMLAEQRKAAHSAIDMDDWNKAEEILAGTKSNIAKIETLKRKFAEFKSEAVKLGFLGGDAPEEKSAEPEPKPVEQPKPEPKPVEQPKPEPKPVEQPKPEPKPVEQPKSAPKPVEQPKSAPKPVEQPKPAPKPVEQPKPAPKPVEQPKPAPRSATSSIDILDMDMSDMEEEDEGTKDPIIDACEDLITKFPFSMRLIYSNQKIGKFFTADEVIATNDMSKPKQLSNGLWVETNIPEEKVPAFIRGVMRYCEESVNM